MQQEVKTQEQALNVLIQAVRIGQSKGVYTLEDAELISQAVKLFVKPTDQPKVEGAAEVTEEVKG